HNRSARCTARRGELRVAPVLATMLGIVCIATVASAADLAIPGHTLKIGHGDAVRFVAKNAAGFPMPAPGSATDPTIAGARLAVFDTDTGHAGTLTRLLPASGWSGLRTPARTRGHRSSRQAPA